MTSCQNHLYDTIHMIFINDFSDQIYSVVVRCHDRTPGRKVFSCDCFVDIVRIFLHRIRQCPYSAAVFNSNNDTTVILYRTDDFQTVPTDRASCYQDSRPFSQMLSLFIFPQDPLPDFFYNCWCRCKIKPIFTSLHHLLNILTKYRCRIQFHQLTQTFQRHTDLII